MNILSTVQTQLIGNRVPKDYFVTKGKGQSDITVHAGSYHLALHDAGIEMCNIMTYSSILPAIATEILKPKLTHGCVMETIMAVADAKKGERATVGIIYGWLYDADGNKYGGLVCEYHGDKTVKEVEKELRASLNELYTNGYQNFELRDIHFHSETIVAEKKFATALVSLCFTSYEIPLIEK